MSRDTKVVNCDSKVLNRDMNVLDWLVLRIARMRGSGPQLFCELTLRTGRGPAGSQATHVATHYVDA